MKILSQVGHQGDTQWYRIDRIPETAKRVEKQFIAKSERTGNVHALSGKYTMYEHEDGYVIDVLEDCVLNHTEINLLNGETWDVPVVLPKRDHNPSTIEKGVYYVGIQRSFNPLSKSMEKVRD
jgi:hypothetical protein